MVDRYIVEQLPKRAEKTQSDYTKSLARLRPVFGPMHPKHLKPSHVYAYMDEPLRYDPCNLLILKGFGSAWWARTTDPLINSQLLYQLS